MSSSTISGGDYAPQHRDSLSHLLAGLDQASMEEYLAVSAPTAGRDPASLPGPAAASSYDLEALGTLVDELWPPRPTGTRIPGRKPIHRLPIVCFLLRVCEPKHGVVHNLSEEYSKLRRDEDYRKRSGFPDCLPSRSVFVETHALMVEHWDQFRACMRQPACDGDCPGVLPTRSVLCKIPFLG